MTSSHVTVLNLDHVVLNCTDIDTTLNWYTEQLGLAPERVDEWRQGIAPFPSVRINAHTIIDLINGDTSSGRLDHLCLVITPTDLNELAAQRPIRRDRRTLHPLRRTRQRNLAVRARPRRHRHRIALLPAVARTLDD